MNEISNSFSVRNEVTILRNYTRENFLLEFRMYKYFELKLEMNKLKIG